MLIINFITVIIMYITTVFAFDVMLSPGLTAGSFVVTLLVMSSIDFVFY